MIDFLKYQKLCGFFSILIFGAGAVAYFYNGINYSIDFLGGTEMRVAFVNSVDISDVRASLSKITTSIQSIVGGKEFIVKVSDAGDSLEGSVRTSLNNSFGKDSYSIKAIDRVGPEVSKEVIWNTIMSIIVMLLMVGLYIALRHQYAYAVGAIVALTHDVLIVLAYNIITGEPFSQSTLVGVLWILGYSINDTIVIFAAIRKNLGMLRTKTAYEVVNISINQTLRRTILTSLSTLLVVLVAYFLGGEVLRKASNTMILGVVFGTYSSIYLASPVMMYLDNSLGSSGKQASLKSKIS